MFKKLLSLNGRNFVNGKYQSFKQYVPEQLSQKIATGCVVTGCGSFVLITAYMYKQNADIYRVIDTNNISRKDKTTKSWKITKEQTKKEIEIYLIDSVRKNEINRLKFISESELCDDAPWDSCLLLNQTIIGSDIQILNFMISTLDSKNVHLNAKYTMKMFQGVINGIYKDIIECDDSVIILTIDSLSKNLARVKTLLF